MLRAREDGITVSRAVKEGLGFRVEVWGAFTAYGFTSGLKPHTFHPDRKTPDPNESGCRASLATTFTSSGMSFLVAWAWTRMVFDNRSQPKAARRGSRI